MTQAPDHTAAVAHLRAADATLGGIIDRLGPLERKWAVGTPFEALVRSIMNQQLAVAAAAAIHRRLIALMPGGQPTPEAILALDDDQLRAAGVSRQKTAYLRDLSRNLIDGALPLERLAGMDDEGVIEALTRVKCIGKWSAEIFLMSALERPDVLASGDVGLLTAAQRAYGLDKRPSPTEFSALAEPWRPWRTVACLYLWRSLR